MNLAEDSLEKSSLIVSENYEKYLRMSSAAIVIGALKVNVQGPTTMTETNSTETDQTSQRAAHYLQKINEHFKTKSKLDSLY